MPSLWSPLTGCGPWLRPSGTRATTGALRTCACPRPDPSARPTWLRSGRMGAACSRPWKGRMRRQTRPRCPQTPFCLSSGDPALVDLPLSVADESEHLARDVALEAPNGFQLGMTLSDALCDIGLGAGIGPKPADGDDVQCAVGGSITASVEAMANDLAGRGRYRAHAT